jgi:hypothetical protein
MRSQNVAIAALFAWTWISVLSLAEGEQFEAGGASVALELPEGFCGISRDDPVGKLFYERQDRMQKGHNRLVQFATPCSKPPRLGEPIPNYALWMMTAPGDVPQEVPATTTRQAFLAQKASEFPTLDIAQLNTEAGKRASSEGLGIAARNKFAVLDQNSDAVFIGQVLTVQGRNRVIDVAVAGAVTTISHRSLNLLVYKMYEGQPNFQELLVPLKAALAKTIAANPS